MYNPFKPHIVQLYNGNYAVRMLASFRWEYYDTEEEFWWYIPKHVLQRASFPNLVQATTRLNECIRNIYNNKHFSKRLKNV